MSILSAAPWTIRPPGTRHLDRAAKVNDEHQQDSGTSSTKLVVSLFGPSEGNYVVHLLELFAAGVKVGAVEDTIALNVVGSSAASISSVAAHIFVLKPIFGSDDDAQVCGSEELQEALQQRLDEFAQSTGNLAKPAVWILPADDNNTLLAEKSFQEFRFGVQPQGDDIPAKTLSKISAEFATFLENKSAGIAYMNYPVKWLPSQHNSGPLTDLGESAGDYLWLKFGVGVPHGLVEPVELQLEAYRLAANANVALAMHDASSTSDEMGDRFRLVYSPDRIEPAAADENGQENPAVADENGQEDPATHFAADHVFFEAKVTPGLLGQVLSSINQSDYFLHGAVMTVVQNRTVAALVSPRQFSRDLQESLKGILDTDVGRVDEIRGTYEGPDDQPTPERDSIWMAWSGPDQPGVLLSALTSVVEGAAGLSNAIDGRSTEEAVNSYLKIESFTTRVLRPGQRCAGKIKLSLAPSVAKALVEKPAQIETKFQSSVGLETDQQGLNFNFVIKYDEPTEDPWASLTLGS